MPRKEREFFDPLKDRKLRWRRVAGDDAGLEEIILSEDADTGDYTRLLRLPPGADTSSAGTLTHSFWEEVWILEGEIHDIRLGRTFTRGMYACRPPGMPHGPWKSPHGAMTIEMRYGSTGSATEKRHRVPTADELMQAAVEAVDTRLQLGLTAPERRRLAVSTRKTQQRLSGPPGLTP